MRWTPKPEPYTGKSRYRHSFLWWPKCINGQWRWGEYAEWYECWRSPIPREEDGPPGIETMRPVWVPLRWAPSHEHR